MLGHTTHGTLRSYLPRLGRTTADQTAQASQRHPQGCMYQNAKETTRAPTGGQKKAKGIQKDTINTHPSLCMYLLLSSPLLALDQKLCIYVAVQQKRRQLRSIVFTGSSSSPPALHVYVRCVTHTYVYVRIQYISYEIRNSQ